MIVCSRPLYVYPDDFNFTSSRHAQLQKARREIAEGNKRFCKDCGTPLSESDKDEFTDLCIGCYIWHT